MKTTILSLCILSLLISSCKKNDKPDAPDPALLENYPQTWLLTIDETPTKYTHLELFGNNMKRSTVDKSYNLITLSQERFCSFIVSTALTEFTSKACYKMQFEYDKKRWLTANPSPNKKEVHLNTTKGSSETSDPGGDNYKFFVHNLGKVNGVKTVALESVYYPGYYISNEQPGLEYSPTQVVLTKAAGPEKATPWFCR